MAKDFFIVTAPSGSGKTTLMHRVMAEVPGLEFSISATTRYPREGEVDGRDYYFITVSDFLQRIDDEQFVEWEQVYPQKYYGTLKSEIQRIRDAQHRAILDIDVLGAYNIKQEYQDRVVAIFIAPPSVEVLEKRLIDRGSETTDTLQERLERVSFELRYQDKFDYLIINEDLDTATEELVSIFRDELASDS